MVVLCYAKDQLAAFHSSLSSIMQLVKSLTGQIFVPTVVQSSPVHSDTDMIVMLRNIERLDKLKLDTDSILDEKKLVR